MWRIGLLCILCLSLSLAARAGGSRVEPSHLMRQKMSPVLMMKWETTGERRRHKMWAECFLRITGELTPRVRQALEQAGAVVRSVIPEHRGRQRPATLLTARIRLADLPTVAALHFVEAIEYAARVGTKQSVKTTK